MTYKDTYDEIEYVEDGLDDYYDQAMSLAADEDGLFRESTLCEFWMERRADAEKSV